jgi:hypothetical protein
MITNPFMNKDVESKFDGGVGGLIGITCLRVLVSLLMLVIGAGVVALIIYFKLGEYNVDLLKKDALTLGICAFVLLIFELFGIAWEGVISLRWSTRHTIINGQRLKFTGTTWQLFGNALKWMFLCIITIFIYALWIPIRKKQWDIKHTVFEEDVAKTANTPNMPIPPVYVTTSCANKCPSQNTMPYAPYTFGNQCPYSQNNNKQR